MIQQGKSIQNDSGLQLLVANEGRPRLRVVLPGYSEMDRMIEVIFAEHVTARRRGSFEAELLYSCGRAPKDPPSWRRFDRSWEYIRDLNGIRLLARASLEDNGVAFCYQFSNCSATAYDMIYAVTDPRLTSIFHDVRLERTFVHHSEGFDLLASETPERMSMPLSQWLPCRYLASFRWPVSTKRVELSEDGPVHYNKSRAVDVVIATQSTDGGWIVASFAAEAGNVWTNPELTCLHADPQTPLPIGEERSIAMKLLILRGSLDELLASISEQLGTLA